MTGKQLIVTCMIILTIAIVIVIGIDFIAINKCLDSKGHWDPKAKTCSR